MQDITLGWKLAGDIAGKFVVPSYQRGYRWGADEVRRLLDDIYENQLQAEADKNYCLQPVVVAHRADDTYELIDGQQRLTTIYLIRQYMHQAFQGAFASAFHAPAFTLRYETREKSEAFLAQIDRARRDENIDFSFLCGAYDTIEAWFAAQPEVATAMMKINEAFTKYVNVIWYEVEGDDEETAIRMFERLNIGRIPLTSAELVKAMFLSSAAQDDFAVSRQEEIAQEWDAMERELHRPELWAFLSNDEGGAYGTRIDLVLDLIAGKEKESREKYQTFFFFAALRAQGGTPLKEIWDTVDTTFLLLLDWYEDPALYHKIGYLIASGAETLRGIYEASKGKSKHAFQAALDAMIQKSVRLGDGRNYGDLSYERHEDCERMSRLLLLFNVASVAQTKTQRFPFATFKQTGGRSGWSLEHIHAQHSKGMVRDEKIWREWLLQHLQSLRSLPQAPQALVEAMEAALEKEPLTGDVFDDLSTKALQALSEGTGTAYLHSIANLALLGVGENSLLSNSAFDAKRNKILEMDREGKYLPFCTRMVFLKYYTKSGATDLHFWGAEDRKAYIAAMNRVLEPYLAGNEIVVEKEEA